MAKLSRSKPALGELLLKNPRVLAVLRRHGVHFCAGCYITLFSSPQKAASYHAVPDVDAFLRDLRAALRGKRKK